MNVTPIPALDGARPIPPRLPLRDSFLSLRDVPQLSFQQARHAFPMVHPACPAEWKRQIRDLRNRLNEAQAELQDPADRLQILAFSNMDGRRRRYGIAANMALAMASIQDTRVLVIDANLIAPSLHTALGLPDSPGLCEASRADRLALPPCFRRIAGTQVYLLPAGNSDVFPESPLSLDGLQALLHSLRSQFDWIFLDAPGFDTPTDALAFTLAADGLILMIDREYDDYAGVTLALSQVERRRLLGAVLY
ncbi:MAG TPA: hypothetical protein VFQ91_01985 [Bryobacteraceae bacterium]|nr:hypothetical protein [Bryobacteraceae bacterium]